MLRKKENGKCIRDRVEQKCTRRRKTGKIN
jgi:hypothetical protein